MTKLLIVGAVAVAFVAAGAPTIRERAAEVAPAVSRLLERADAGTQSSAQISAAEFLRIPKGVSQGVVRARIGEPESRHRVAIEKLELECWYYGIAAASGMYQLCFADGKLSTKVGFGATR